jgi:protein gp37
MGDTKIEWTGKTWNPIRARNKATGKIGWFCERVSEGCRNCYAEKMNRNTYFGNGLDYKPAALDQVELFLDEKILEQPLHWRKPTKVFPCSMTDLFGRWVKDEWIDKIHHVMWRASQHTFQILTKRPDRMLAYMNNPNTPGLKPLSNVWLGVSAEDQKTADERIPLLLQTPAAVRWISAEPLLGPIDLTHLCGSTLNALDGIDLESIGDIRDTGVLGKGQPERGIDWVVVGGESGPKSRPMHPDWARSLRERCVAAGIPFFFKQHGDWIGSDQQMADGGDPVLSECDVHHKWPNGKPSGPPHFGMNYSIRTGKKAAGRLLDGREWNEFPTPKAARVTA